MTTWRNNPRLNIDKDNLYDLYFNEKLSKREICKLLNCSEKAIDKRFKLWGWRFRDNGKMVGEFMRNKSTILPHLENIKKLYIEEKKTCAEIGKIYKVTECSISRLLKKNGVIIRKLAEAQVRAINIDKDYIFNLYVGEHKSCEQIANIIKSSPEVVRRSLVKYDISRRDRASHLSNLTGARKIFKDGSFEEIEILKNKISKSSRKFFEKDIDEKIINKNLIRLSSIDKENKVLLKCMNDGFEWKSSISHILHDRGCPICRFKNQKEAFVCLQNLIQVKIIHPYKLTTYFYEEKYRNLYIDFYFEYNNKKVVVEYQGEQHYRSVTFNGITQDIANKNFERQKIRDEVVRKYCGDMNIILIEIDGREYNIYKDNIKQYLELKLKEIV